MKLRPLQRLQARLGPFLGFMSPRLQRRLAGKPIVLDGQTLAPDMQLLLRAIEMRGGIIAATPTQLRKRQQIAAVVSAGAPVPVATKDLIVDGLRARHYASTRGAPLVVFFHGGGFVFGDLETHDRLCRVLSVHAGVHVLAIEYRLAPEFPFPAGLDDAERAWQWARGHASELDADPHRIAVAGDSAGGNLATLTAQRHAGTREAPCAQLLLYPTVDHDGAYASKELFADGFFLTREAMTWFHEHYVDAAARASGDPRLQPITATALAKQPPAILITAGFDPLRDEGEAYAASLRGAGSWVVVRRFGPLIHGFANMTGVSRSAHDAVIEIAGMLRAVLAIESVMKQPLALVG